MFGRKKAEEEDPFAALKQGGTYQSASTTTVEGIPGSGLGEEPTIMPAPAPATPVAPSGTPGAPTISSTFAPAPPATPTAPAPTRAPAPPTLTGGTRQTKIRPMRAMRVNAFGMSRGVGPGRLIAWLVVLGIGAAIVVPIISTTRNAIHAFSVPSFGFPNTTGNPGTSIPVAPPAPNRSRATNYLKAAGLRSGLRSIAKRFPGAGVTNLRIDAHSLDTFVFPRHGAVKSVDFTSTGTFISSGASTGQKPTPVSAIPVSAVPRIVAAMKRQFHVPPSRIDYMVLGTFAGSAPEWVAFSKAPSHPGFAASLDGTGLHRL